MEKKHVFYGLSAVQGNNLSIVSTILLRKLVFLKAGSNMILLRKKSHELNGTAAKYLDQNSTAGYFDRPSNPAAQAQQSCSTGPETPAFAQGP